VNSDPILLLSLLAVRLLGSKSVPAADDALKALKKGVEKAVEAGLLQKGETRLATTTRGGKSSTKKVAALDLTPQGEAFLQQAAAPEVYGATQSGLLTALQQSLDSDRQRLRDEVQAALSAKKGKTDPAKVQKELEGLSKKVEQLLQQMAKLETTVRAGDDGSALLTKIDQAFAGMQTRLEEALRTLPPAPKPEPAPSPRPSIPPTPPTEEALPDVLRKAYEKLCLYVEFRDGLVEMPRLYHEARKTLPGLSVKAFHDAVMALWDRRELELHVLNEVERAVEPDKAIEHHDKLYYYVLWKRP